VYATYAPAAEQAICARLKLSHDLAAFVIVRSFARFAATRKKYQADGSFPLSGQDLAIRLQMGVRNAYNLRKRLIQIGCIKKVSEWIRAIKAEYYVWLLDSPFANDP
jgi:hypothetical protein